MLKIPRGRNESVELKESGTSSWAEYLDERDREFRDVYGSGRARGGGDVTGFEAVRTVGTGWYGRVYLVRKKSTGSYHALKVFSKETIVRLGQVRHVHNEKNILEACRFPFITRLEMYFSDALNIYLVMPFVLGGELFGLLRRLGRLEETSARFYIAQMILVLEYLHRVGVVYRDIKPENVLIDSDGYVKVTDFGFAKLLEGRTFTMCGTPEYLAPEMISSLGYDTSVDWWSLGVLLFEMTSGHTPFSPEDSGLFARILSGFFPMPRHFSDDLKTVVDGLLQVSPWRRLTGSKLRAAPWFRSINWLALLDRRIPAPHPPVHSSPHDPSNYDLYEEVPLPSISTPLSSDPYAHLFEGF